MSKGATASGFERALDAYARAFQRWLPSPFSIAVLLTLLAGVLALQFSRPLEVMDSWVTGLWNPALLRFGFQAMFMLVLYIKKPNGNHGKENNNGYLNH